MNNKRGQDLSTSTIILIILGIAVLVILIIGFTTGWSFFKNMISPTNVDATIQDCASVCETGQQYSFCSADRTLRVNEEKISVKTSCYALANLGYFKKYNIQNCVSLNCNLACDQIAIDTQKGVLVDAVPVTAKYDVTSIAVPVDGKFCVIQ
jgi:hypothetical protein